MTVIGPRSSCEATFKKSVFARSRAAILEVRVTRSRPAVMLAAYWRSRPSSSSPNRGLKRPDKTTIAPLPCRRSSGVTSADPERQGVRPSGDFPSFRCSNLSLSDFAWSPLRPRAARIEPSESMT